MRLTEIFRNYNLKYREKCGNAYYKQLFRLLKMLFQSPLASHRQGVLKVMLGLTYDCQCNCLYCCAGLQPRSNEKELSVKEIKNLIQAISRLPSFFTLISFFGGEALLKESIFELIQYACRWGLFTETETNGILLSAENVKKLKQAGLHHIFIRLESTDDKLHDDISRFQGCYESAREGIRRCVAAKLSCSISTIAFKDKIYNGELERIINLGKRLGVTSVRIIYPTRAGKLLNGQAQLLGPKDKKLVRELLRPDFVYLESTQICVAQLDRICPAKQKKLFYVSCYGDVQPCPFVPYGFGNIRQEKVCAILSRMNQQNIFDSQDYGGCLMDDPELLEKQLNHALESGLTKLTV